ncbi:MAG: hypothetical protein AAF612_12200 [Planctomycetota bacterium]
MLTSEAKTESESCDGRAYRAVDALVLVLCLPLYALVGVLLLFHKCFPESEASRIRRWRREYTSGAVLSQFLAPDIRRDVRVIDTNGLEDGVLTVQTRTWNVLYTAKAGSPEPEFGPVRDAEIEGLWRWRGHQWAVPMPADDDDPMHQHQQP